MWIARHGDHAYLRCVPFSDWVQEMVQEQTYQITEFQLAWINEFVGDVFHQQRLDYIYEVITRSKE